MAVGSAVPYNAHTGNGVTTVFGYAFTLLDAADLVVTINGVVTSAYTVAGLGNANGGAITFTSPPANGAAIFLQRVIQLVRETEYQNNGDLQAPTLNDDFDRLWMAVQGGAYDVSRALRVPETTAIPALPVAADRANKLLSFNASGLPVVSAPVEGTATDLALDLADASGTTKGAAMIGLGSATLYPYGPTVGYLLSLIKNVLVAGARGNGVTDDVTAIQAAINSLPATGGTVYFPRGTYRITSMVEITKDNVQLIGERGAVLRLADGVVGSVPNGAMVYAFQRRNITIHGLTLDGNKANNDINDNWGNGIRILDCQRVRIAHNHVYNVSRDGITIEDYTRITALALGNEDIQIHHNLVTGSGATSQTTGGEGIIVVQGNRITIDHNICSGNKYRGIEIETLATTGLYRGLVNVTVTGNVCNSNLYAGIGTNGSSRLAITGNICENNAEYGIRLNNATVIQSALCTITGNRVNGVGVTLYGISVENYEEVTVTGNTVAGCRDNLYLSGVRDVLITGNLISGALRNGINFLNGTNQNLTFVGNLVRASSQSASNTYDNVAGNCTYVTFTANRVDGTSARYGINAAGSSWTIVSNALDNSGTTALINDTTTGARIRDNGGYITEAMGTATIPNGSTSVVVNHGCSRTPPLGSITITGGEDPTASVGTIWVSSIGATQFTINCEVNPGASGFDVGWRVQML